MVVDVERILAGMRDGGVQPAERIEAFVQGLTRREITRVQAAAWLAWAYQRTLSRSETVALTAAMAASGRRISWPEGPLLIDKHSTGGVGDKVSLVLAPLWAELGHRVPMVSGRGLGHTGGTLDKLEAIPGYRTDLEQCRLRQVLEEVGCFITGQTEDLAPADRLLYALRNETRTVPSIPLIVGSILSKKLAAGVRRLILDVKCGAGAFMQTSERALELARALVEVGRGAGLDISARVTEMDQPLGRAVGNALEVREAVASLRGEGPADLREVTLALADDPRAAEVLDSGAAFGRFCRMVEAQGGDPAALVQGLRGGGAAQELIAAPASGVVQRIDALEVGRAAFQLGAGRDHAAAEVDFGVGVELLRVAGDAVERGEPVFRVHHRSERGLSEARAALLRSLQLGSEAPPPRRLCLHHLAGPAEEPME